MVAQMPNYVEASYLLGFQMMERLLGVALGCVFTGVVVFEQRRSIYGSISNSEAQFASETKVREPIFGKKSRSEFAHLWNKAVDQTLGPVIASLSSRGW